MDIMIAPITQQEEEGQSSYLDEFNNAAVQDLLAQVYDLNGENKEMHQNQNSNDVFANSQLTSHVTQNGPVIAIHGSPSNESTASLKVGCLLLTNMNLTTFPSIPIDPSMLSRIDLSYNKLENIPPVFLQDKFMNVYAFDISFNRIKDIPEEFGMNFPKLVCLNVSNNQIKMLPLSLRKFRLSSFNCVGNPFQSALKGIIGGCVSNFNPDCNLAALNLQYFFGIINFCLNLDESIFGPIEESLRKWSNRGNYKATIFFKLVEDYRRGIDQVNENEADEINNERVSLQMKAKWTHQRFCQIVPGEVKKFNLEASMESLESLLHLIDEIQPEEAGGTQDAKGYQDVVNEKFEREVAERLKNEELESQVLNETPPEVKPQVWTKKERRWFLSVVSVVGFIGCYFLFWPLLAVVLVSPDGMELFRRNYLSKVIPYWWTSLLAKNHSLYQGWIFKFLPVFISKHLPIIDYHYPFWRKFWNWISSFFLKLN